jgi:hypothetical protein
VLEKKTFPVNYTQNLRSSAMRLLVMVSLGFLVLADCALEVRTILPPWHE